MRRRLFICGLLLAALVFPAVAGIATGLHLEWAEHHNHTHHGEPHTRLDHEHHSHDPVEPVLFEALLRPAGSHGLDPAAPHHPTPPSVDQADPAPRPIGPRADGAPPGASSRDLLARHCTLLL